MGPTSSHFLPCPAVAPPTTPSSRAARAPTRVSCLASASVGFPALPPPHPLQPATLAPSITRSTRSHGPKLAALTSSHFLSEPGDAPPTTPSSRAARAPTRVSCLGSASVGFPALPQQRPLQPATLAPSITRSTRRSMQKLAALTSSHFLSEPGDAPPTTPSSRAAREHRRVRCPGSASAGF